MASNRSQIYIDTVDNSSKVIQDIAKQIQALQGSLQTMGNSSQSGFNQMNNSLNRQIGLLSSINSQFQNLGGTLMSTAGRMLSIAGAVLLVKNAGEELISLFKQGVEINIQTETTKIGIAGLVATLYDFKKGTEEITGMDKLNTSLVLTESIMKRLRISAIETGASFDEVVEGYRNAVGGGARLGIDPLQLEKISTQVANAAKGFGLDKGQTGQETRALFTGKIDKTATIGMNLGFGPGGAYQKEYKEALKKGGDDFVKFLEGRLEQFANAGKIYANTVGGIFDQIGDTVKLYKGDIASGLSAELLKLKPIADSLFKKGDFNSDLDGLTATLQTIGQIIGENLVGAFKSVIDVVFEISDYLSQDQTLINSLIEGVGLFGDIFLSVADIVGSVFGLFGDIVTSVASLVGITQEEGKELNGIELTVKIITGAVASLGIAFGLVKDIVSVLASSIRLILGGAIDFVMTTFNNFVGAVGRTAGRLGLDNVAKDLDAFQQKVAKNKESAMQTIIGADNKLLNLPGIDASAGEKLNALFNNTVKALDKGAEAFDKANNKENSNVKKYLENMKINREKAGKIDPRIAGVNFSSNAKGGKDEDGKGAGSKGNDITNELLKGYQKELEAFQKGNDFKRKENELFYQNYKKTVEQFYNEKETLDEADYKKQVETYNKEIAVVNQVLGTRKTKKENEAMEVKLLELINKRANAEKEYNLRVQETIFAREKDLRKLQETIDNFKSGIAELTGNKFKSSKIVLDIEIGKLNLENANNPEMLKLIPIYEELKKFKIEQEQQNALLSLSESNLNFLKESGSLTTIDYYKEIGKLNVSRLKQYQEELALIEKLAPGEQDNVRIKELQNLITQTSANLNPLAKEISKTFQDSFGTFFSDVIGGTKSVKDAFKDMVGNIEQMISKLVAQKLTQQIFGGGDSGGGLLGGLLGGSSGGGGGDFFGQIGGFVSSLFGAATGGFMEAGVPRKVGEGGTEIFIPSTSGYMMNASRSAELLNGGRSGGVTNINVSLQTPNATSFNNSEGQVGAMLNNALRKAQRNM